MTAATPSLESNHPQQQWPPPPQNLGQATSTSFVNSNITKISMELLSKPAQELT